MKRRNETNPKLIILLAVIVAAAGGYLEFVKGPRAQHGQLLASQPTSSTHASGTPADTQSTRAAQTALSSSPNPPELQVALRQDAQANAVKLISVSYAQGETEAKVSGALTAVMAFTAQITDGVRFVPIGGAQQLRATGPLYLVSSLQLTSAAGAEVNATLQIKAVVSSTPAAPSTATPAPSTPAGQSPSTATPPASTGQPPSTATPPPSTGQPSSSPQVPSVHGTTTSTTSTGASAGSTGGNVSSVTPGGPTANPPGKVSLTVPAGGSPTAKR